MALPADEAARRLWIEAWLAGASAGWRQAVLVLLGQGGPALQESDASRAFNQRKA